MNSNGNGNGNPAAMVADIVDHDRASIPPLLTPKEAAAALAVSERTLWQLKTDGEIPHVSIGRSVRYDPADLREWIERQKKSG